MGKGPSAGARVFTILVFTLLGLSFIATSAALIYEFENTRWFAIGAMYSHLFVFFPTFGLIVLYAFYIPSAVFVDLYWHHIPFGRIRFIFWTLFLMALSLFAAGEILEGKVPALFELTPQTLQESRSVPSGCGSERLPCSRLSVLDAVDSVRAVSRKRIGLSKFARDCAPDPLVEISPDRVHKRFCFVTRSLVTAEGCCEAQRRFTQNLTVLAQSQSEASLTAKLHAALLPLKVFFLLILLVIGMLLVFWRGRLDVHYKDCMKHLERGILIGAFAMLFWPVSNHAFLLSSSLLYGAYGDGVYATVSPGLSILYGGWVFLLLIFFFRHMGKDMEAAGKIAGVIGGAVAIFKYDELINYAVRWVGAGADTLTFTILAVVGLIALWQLGWYGSQRRRDRAKFKDAPAPTGTPLFEKTRTTNKDGGPPV